MDAKAPTCTEDGSIEYYACACGALFADAEGKKALTASEIADAMKGHTWDEGKVTTAATCTAKGVKTYTCSAYSTTKTEEVAMVVHTLTKVDAKAATCTEAGNIEHYTCSG